MQNEIRSIEISVMDDAGEFELRSVSLSVEAKDRISVCFYGGHCSSCAEEGSTSSITIEELYNLLNITDSLEKSKAAGDKNLVAKIEELTADVKNLQTKLRKREDTLFEKISEIETLKKTISLVKEP